MDVDWSFLLVEGAHFMKWLRENIVHVNALNISITVLFPPLGNKIT